MNPRSWYLRMRGQSSEGRLTLADECEAYLDGRSAAVLEAQGRTPPAWAQLNRVAHGSSGDLTELASGGGAGPDGRRRVDTWPGALARLAEQLLAGTEDDVALRAIQVAALWPLEGQLLDSRQRIELSPQEVFIVAHGCIVEAVGSSR
jgi:hypothetical protein